MEVALRGLSSAGNDYDCQDGELQVCHNAINNGAGLRPIQEPTAIAELPAGWKGLAFVHHTSAGDTYIIRDGSGNAWYGKADDIQTGESAAGALTQMTEPQAGLFKDGEYQLSSVGNVLVVNFNSTDVSGIHYYRYDAYKKTYSYIGQYPPDVALEFELFYDNSTEDGTEKTMDLTVVEVEGLPNLNDRGNIMGNTVLQDALLGEVNKITDKAKRECKFLSPFFVRYAYRMYDGTYIMQSAPVLMVPDYGANPMCIFYYLALTGTLSIGHRAMSLRARSKISTEDKILLEKWEDIIQGISIFITPQILNYSLTGSKLNGLYSYRMPDGSLTGVGPTDDVNDRISPEESGMFLNGGTFSVAKVFTKEDNEADSGGSTNSSRRHRFFENVATDSENTKLKNSNYVIRGFQRDGTLEDWINGTYVFYKLKEYTIAEACALGGKTEEKGPAGFTTVKREGSDGIVNLTTFEQLPDGYRTRSLNMPKYVHTYNGRLNIANVDVREIPWFPIGFLSSYTALGQFVVSENPPQYAQNGKMAGYVTVYIEDNGSVRTATAQLPFAGQTSDGEWGTLNSMPGYFFYPDPNAKWLHIYVTNRNTETSRYEDRWLPLKQHPFLYGAFYFDGYYGFEKAEHDEPEIARGTIEGVSHQTNYMYTSEVDNPFMFPSEGVNAIGSGEIVAIKSASKSMSEGTAFGSMPLYAFCTDGVWPLSVGETGLFVATNPPTRETLVNNDANALLQTDNAVIFMSDRGLMRLVGESTVLLSGQLRERFGTFDVAKLPGWDAIMGRFDDGAKYLEADDFLGFIRQGARLAFDYVNYRVIVFRPYDANDESTHTAYVYDVASESWATMASTLTASVEGYPASMVNVIGNGGKMLVARFDHGNTVLAGGGKAFYATRPMKFGKADTLKTVRTLFERAVSHGGAKYLGLWGSRDMTHWIPIGAVKGGRMPRLSGTPYKYFIAAGWSELDVHGDTISRLTVEEADKYQDKIR